jgi:hypothetical protein
MSRPSSRLPLRSGRALASSALLTGVWLLASACGPGVASPMPEPPTAVFDLDGINRDPMPATVDLSETGAAYVLGGMGTVPANATVRITNLNQTYEVFATTATDSGSFKAIVFAQSGDELRFEWVKDGRHSEPVDALAQINPDLKLVSVEASPRFDCVTLYPGFALDFSSDAAQTLSVTNRCAEPLTLDNSRTRLGLTDFSVDRTLPLEVAPDETAELGFGFARTVGGLREDVWFVDVTLGAQTMRYPVTLRSE